MARINRSPLPLFEQWMQRVDAVVQKRTGLSVHDLPDCPFRDWYDNGLTPREASVQAIRSANE